LLSIYAVPNQGVSTDDVEAAIYEEAQRIADSGVTEEELQGFKARARSQFIQGLDSNMGLAGQLCWAQMILGDWRELFKGLARINAVTAEDVQRAAAETFVKSNRSVGVIKTLAQSS
jgi:predicted Zn-dependent peptidase